jgi:glycosyltransferase involved in cell wall biosynthesis
MEDYMSAKGGSVSGGKICLINNLYKPFNRGGAEKITETIANGLVKAGHEVFIITTKPRNQLSITNYQLRIYYLNSLYYNLNKFPKFLRFFWQIWNVFNFVNYFKIKNILHKEKCDAVITNNLMGLGFLTPLAIKNLGIKHLYIVHDIQLIHPSGLMYYGEEKIIDNFFSKIYSGLCRYLFNSPSVVIFPSNWLKGLYTKRNFFAKSKISVLPNPVEDTMEQAREQSSNFKFLFLGQIEKHKGVFLLIDAFNKIKEKYPEVELLLVGDGSKIKEAREKAAGNNNIKFLGWPGDEKADKLLFSANCLVYPSLVYENCPNAIQRAITANLLVLASNLGGIPELLNENAGILFKPADVNDLAEKMEWMIKNKDSLNNLIVSKFKVEDYIKKLEEIIKL